MDPPPFHHHTNQKSRYVNVFSPPNFMPPFHQRNRPPPPPPPRPRPPHHLLSPLPPHHIPHNPLPPASPSYFRLSHPHPPDHRSIEENLHRYEFDRPYSPTPLPPPPPLARWTELPPPPPPIAPDHIQFRPADNYPDRNPMFKDALFLDEIRNRYGDSSINDIPHSWGQGLLRGGRRIEDTDFGKGHIERHRQQFGSQSEKNFNIEPLRAHDSYNYRDEDNRRWDYNVSDRDSYHLQYKEPVTGDHSLARFRGRLGRGGRVKEFVRSPRNKQVQKKSALLRIQLGKTSNRNRGGHEYHHFPKEPSSNGLRGKEKQTFVPSQRKMEGETDRDRSPVELDVSFKSNALVAKAIVTSSSPGLDSDRILTPRNSNIKKVSVSGSPSARLNSITSQELEFQYDSEKAPKESKEEVAVSRSENTNDTCASYLGDINADNGSPKAIGSDVGGNGIGSDETSIRRVRKKRKVDRRLACESSLQLTKDRCEIYNANTQANSPAVFSQLGKGTTISEGRKAASGSDTVPDIVLQASSNELDISKAQEQLESIFSGKDVSDIDCSIHFGPDSDTERILSPKFSDSAGLSGDASTERINHEGQLLVPEDADHAYIMGINEDTIPADRMVANENAVYANKLDSNEHIDNVDKVQAVADLGTSEVDSEQFNNSGTEINSAREQQPFEDSVILPLDGRMRGVSELRVLVEDHDTSGFSRPKETRIHEIIQGDESEIHGLYSPSNPESEMFKRAETVTLCNFGFTDVGSAEYFPDQVDMVQDGQKEQGKICSSLLAEDTRITVSDAIADNPNLSSVITSSTIFLSTDWPGVALSDISRKKAICGKSFKDIPTGSLEHNLVAFSRISHSPNFKWKRNDGDAPNAAKTSEERNDVAGSVGDEEKGFVEDLIFTEEDDPCARDNGKNGNDSCPGNPKKRKVVSPRLSHFSLSEFCEGSEAADSGSLTAEVLMDINRSKVQSECSVMPPLIDSPSVCLSPCVTQIATSFPAESIGCNCRTQCSKLDWNSQSLQVKGIDGKEDNPTVEAEATNRQDTACTGSKISRDVFDAPDVNKTPGDDDGSSENYLIVNDDLAFLPNNSSLLADGNDISATSSGDELMDSGPDLPSHMYPTEDLHSDPDSNLLKNTQASPIRLTNETVGMNDHISTEKVVAAYPMPVLPKISPKKSSAYQFATTSLTSQSLSQNTSKSKHNINPVCGVSYLSKHQPTSTVPSVFPGNPALSLNRLKRVIPSAHVTKSRTWHRTGNSSITVARPKLQSFHGPQSHVHKTVGNIQSSYVRKGNSLVRKSSLSDISHGFHSSSSSVYRLSPSHVDNSKDQISINNSEAVNPPSVCRTGVNTPSGRSESLTRNGELLNCTALNLGESMSLPLLSPPSNNFPATNSDPSDSASKSSIHECQTGSGNNSDSQSTLDEGNSGKKITYIKQKSYQLIAASDSEDPAPQSVGKTKQASSSDGYYKRRTNQLIRASLENHLKKDALADGSFGTYKPRSRRVAQSRSASEQQSGFSKTRKTSKFSLVWKLCDTQSAKDSKSLRRQRVRPYLFPWKRSTYWRNFINNIGSQNGSPHSMISRKLLLSRKRGAMYTRSTHGFSLRISKVLSVGGSSLKWSKSIERNSKKVNEEATRAVAAAEQRKKEQNVPTLLKNRNHVSRKSVRSVKLCPGERIFRIGSERYKMDSTGKTLKRITDEPSDSAVQKPEKKIKNSYVPRRLLIGNEEYVRIGNGNQLVRNPKKRTRILASERVRWSLHTARLRLARKRKYCQFFTRFGKCNKDDGKCPYIHDPSKIVVCTKFLKGSCSNTECKLTHKVIPERMQDCSYFLQGICSNENCPYRHVNVNPNSSVCESFLRGYCADGNECRKKHTYVCPAFEANGICPEGSKCKLHHPKRKRGMKRKSFSEQKNTLGRYFDSGPFDVAESRAAIIGRLPAEGNDVVQEEGMLGDFISLDVDEELEHTVVPVHRERNERPLDDQLDLDDLIKPIGIMNRNPTIHTSPDI